MPRGSAAEVLRQLRINSLRGLPPVARPPCEGRLDGDDRLFHRPSRTRRFGGMSVERRCRAIDSRQGVMHRLTDGQGT